MFVTPGHVFKLPVLFTVLGRCEVITTEYIEEAGCAICWLEEGLKPAHFASPLCESGGYPHCSCSICF